MPRVNGKVLIDGNEHEVCIRPVLRSSNFGWAISNFRKNEESIVYTEGGPHIKIMPSGHDFIEIVKIGESSGIGKLSGTLEILSGRAACDVPTKTLRLENMSLQTTRHKNVTRFHFLSNSINPLNKNDKSSWSFVEFWFEVPDDLINLLVPDATTRESLSKKIVSYDQASNS
jgi:hypothetical protein